VLKPFPWDQQDALDETLAVAAAAVRCWAVEGTDQAMNSCNRRQGQFRSDV
jgi:hypothetical protein